MKRQPNSQRSINQLQDDPFDISGSVHLATRSCRTKGRSTGSFEPAKCRWNTDSFGSAKRSRCRNINSFSLPELHDRTGNTSCSTFDVRAKGHQNASVYCGLGSPMKKIEKRTSHSLQIFPHLKHSGWHRCSSHLRRRTNARADWIPRERSYAFISRTAKWIWENHRLARQPFHSHGQPRLCS